MNLQYLISTFNLFSFQFHTTNYVTPETICTTCSTKLKDAFDFREYLIKMNSHWETRKPAIVVPNSKLQSDPQPQEIDVDPPLEVVIIGDSVHNPENFQTITEYVYYEPIDDEKDDQDDHDIDDDADDDDDKNDSVNYDVSDDDVNRTAESEDDEKFIGFVQDFVNSIKPVPVQLSQLRKVKPVRPAGKLLTAKSARVIAADEERLNFRSTSCPHSSQKLKKHDKWWRLMHDCNYCDAKDFLTVEAMNKHLKVEHADLVKVSCDICKKDYSEVTYCINLATVIEDNFYFSIPRQLKYLRKHMKYVHQTRQNECEICKKKFYYNYNLKSHMQVHTNEKTVICHLCGKFFTPVALHRHLRTGIHGPVNKTVKDQIAKTTRYYCHICVPAKRFNLCAELTEHRRLQHNDFECPICKGWFSCSEALQNHLKTHSNKERKHSCKVSEEPGIVTIKGEIKKEKSFFLQLCPSTYVRASHLEGNFFFKFDLTIWVVNVYRIRRSYAP